jgi:uncharacterized protein (TIGR00295 family)
MTEALSREKCLAMLKEAGCTRDVIEHCIAVEKLASKIAALCTKDQQVREMVCAGALLHDIGRSQTHGIWHAVEGAKILRAKDLDEEIVHIVERHIGAGITAQEAAELGLPAKNYIPETLAEKIVAHADNLVGDAESPGARRTLAEAVKAARAKGLDALAERMEKLHEELSQLCEKDIDEIV